MHKKLLRFFPSNKSTYVKRNPMVPPHQEQALIDVNLVHTDSKNCIGEIDLSHLQRQLSAIHAESQHSSNVGSKRWDHKWVGDHKWACIEILELFRAPGRICFIVVKQWDVIPNHSLASWCIDQAVTKVKSKNLQFRNILALAEKRLDLSDAVPGS